MNRQQRRASEKKEEKFRTKTYNLTEEQLDKIIKEAIRINLKSYREQFMNDAVNNAMILMLTLPLEVLMDYYWPKSYAKRIPEFTKHVLEYYERWQNGELDIDRLKEDLWEYGGVRLEAEK